MKEESIMDPKLKKQKHSNLPSRSISIETLEERHIEEYVVLEAFKVMPNFDGLSSNDLKRLLNYFDREEWKAGSTIISEEEEAGLASIIMETKNESAKKQPKFYVVSSGTVKMTAKGSKKNEVTLTEMGPGKWFGSLVEDHPGGNTLGAPDMTKVLRMEPVSVIAIDDVVLLSIDSDKCIKTVKRMRRMKKRASGKRATLENYPLLNIKQMLRKLPFFHDISEMKLQQLAALFEFTKSARGDVVCSQGDEALGFFIIYKGTIEVFIKSSEDEEIKLNTLNSGDWFGEIALIQETKRTASVRALDDCTLLFLSRERFSTFLNVAPEILDKGGVFVKALSKRTANSLKSFPLFSSIIEAKEGDKKLQVLGEMFKFVEYEKGDVIFKQGDIGTAFFIISKGKVSVTTLYDNSEIHLTDLSENDWFGEIALVNHTHRTATVTALTKCSMMKLQRDDFEKFLSLDKTIKARVEEAISHRISKSLKQNYFFNELKEIDAEAREALRSMFSFEEYEKGDVVFQQGETGNKLYIIFEGSVTLTRLKLLDAEFDEDVEDETVDVDSKEGDYNQRKKLEIIDEATVKTIPLKIPFFSNEESLNKKLSTLPHSSSDAKQLHIKSLPDESFPAFSLVVTDADKMEELNEKLEKQILTANESKKRLSDHKEQQLIEGTTVIGELQKGDFFGGLSVLKNLDRTYTATCKSNCLLASITSEKFLNFIKIAPPIKDLMLKKINNRTAILLKGFDVFQCVMDDPISRLENIVDLLKWEQMKAGEFVFQKGDVGEKMYFIVSGAVKVTAPEMQGDGASDSDSESDNEKDEVIENKWKKLVKSQSITKGNQLYLNTLRQGAYFGEVGVMRAIPRTASVQCVRDCIFLSLSREDFPKLIKIIPEIEKPILKRVRARYMHLRTKSQRSFKLK